MKAKKYFSIILCSVIVFVCLPFHASAQIIPDGSEYVTNQVVFEYEGSYEEAYKLFVTLHPEFGINTLTQTPDFGAETTTLVADIDTDVEKLCKTLSDTKGVNYAEPNFIYTTDSFTMPTEITSPTSYYTNYEKWYLNDVMNIPAAWQKYEKTGENVVVAVIDNGFNLNATEFPQNLWSDANGNHGWNTHLNTNDISPIYGYIKITDEQGNITYEMETDENGNSVYKLGPLEDSSHGSNVAGIIGMTANNSQFIGAAYNAQLMLINAAQYKPFADSTSFSAADVATAVRYATANGADVINMSLGSSVYAQSIKNAVDAAYNAGIAVIAAAGNGDGSGTHAYSTADSKYYPAASQNVIGVMAIDKTDQTQLAAFSNYDTIGEYYDIAAPGVSVVGCSCTNGQYSVNSGTSQACPLVAACAAIYLSVYPDATVQDLYNAIRNSSTKTVVSNKTYVEGSYTFKSLDAVMLLDYGEQKPELIFDLINTTVTHDVTRDYIYGLDENFTDISKYMSVKSGTGTMVFTPTPMGNGTGSTISIYKSDGSLYKIYHVIIFGDVNGDCRADGQDTVIISCIKNNFTTYPEFIRFAADVNFNDTVDDEDLVFSFGYPLKNELIFQTR